MNNRDSTALFQGCENRKARCESPQTIALLVPSLGLGGGEKVAVNLAKGLAALGFTVDLVAGRGGCIGELAGEGVHMTTIGRGRMSRAILPLARYLHRARPDVVVSFSVHATIALLLAKWVGHSSCGVVGTVHKHLSGRAHVGLELKDRLTEFVARFMLPWVDGVVCASEPVLHEVDQMTRGKCRRLVVLPNPVYDSSTFLLAACQLDDPWLTDGKPFIMAASRLAFDKGLDTLVRAFAQVENRDGLRLLILGEGPARHHIEELISSLHLGHEVRLPGYSSNPYAFMQRCSAFVLSSPLEACPTVVVEALVLGRPVACTDCFGEPLSFVKQLPQVRTAPVGDVEKLGQAMSQCARMHAIQPLAIDERLGRFSVATATAAYVQLIEAL